MIIPSIDLIDGKAVQLRQGKEKVLERSDVIALAKKFRIFGELAVIDLDAALGKSDNFELVKKLCSIADCRVGGGIRNLDKAYEVLRCGARKIIIGTKANRDFLSQLPRERVIVAVDSKGDNVVDNGWRNDTGVTVADRVIELSDFCSEFLFTNVDKEGLMQGIDFAMVMKLRSLTSNKITIAGGITTNDDIETLQNLGCNSQIGMALYTGKISLDEAFVSLLDFGKGKGLVPTIVQDDSGRVLMFAFSSKKSLMKTFSSGRGTFFSRSRKGLWTKGETSGNFQDIVKVRFDCDRDALLFTVKQKNVACHNGGYTCFGEKDFCLEDLYSVLLERIETPKKGSYTSQIGTDEKKILKKIEEETNEVVSYANRDNLVWEIADLTYFLLVLMAKKGISMKDVKNALSGRRK